MMSASVGTVPPDLEYLFKNISRETLEEFIRKSIQHQNKNYSKNFIKHDGNYTDFDECQKYCDHGIRDLLTEYKLYHGYITLAVSNFKTNI
jgi:hypothetical protein